MPPPSPPPPRHLTTSPQAGAILRAEVFGIPRPDWADSAAKVAEVAAAVDIPAFVPRAGVQIETDPKADRTKPAGADKSEAQAAGVGGRGL